MRQEMLDHNYELADGYRREEGRPDNYRHAIALCREGDAADDPRFTNMLGYFSEHGFGVKQDESKALKYYERAAGLGLAIAKYNCGVMYAERGAQERAVASWREAAEMDETYSMLKLGWAYEHGLGVPQNCAESVQYYETAAEHKNALGALELIRLMREEKGIEKNISRMVELLDLAREQDHPDAWLETGLMYDNGDLPAENQRNEAMSYFEKAAELGSTVAQEWCGERYAMGIRDVKRDITKGIGFLKQAAAAGRPRAKYVLACLHASGEGVTQDYEIAFQLCQEAAETGEPAAQKMLAMMHNDGLGL
ncbi:Putative beta-lactamase HcpC precursor [Symmachiella dynata]|uniref:Beta-lactamase HcpC n=1 Tax=Symmachiella dynata TaxID=2527995 RepID=A0A517ZUE9_9PLAN|nr:SEL1-like repeat protein [Symmachiella dynata]QDU46102.1 Putative beta-lactamase HcpC precursor [Symmachiella dynata]